MYTCYIFNNKPVISGLIVSVFHRSSAAALGGSKNCQNILAIFGPFRIF